MRDRRLVVLVWLVLALSTVHTADHVVREKLRWSMTPEFLGLLAVSVATYGVAGLGLYLHAKGIVGPRFWGIVGGLGFGFGVLAHLSPFAEQTLWSIAAAYDTKVIGWLAASAFVALLALVLATTLYATHLARGARIADRDHVMK